jgi:sulfite oxidase
MLEKITLDRRGLLAGSAAAMAAVGMGLRPTPLGAAELAPYVDFKDAEALIIHSNNTIETRWDAIGTSLITPEDKLFIRNNVAPPNDEIVADRDAWEVEFEGVGEPRTLTVGELKSMGLEQVAMVLQCSGNGRAFFEHEPGGTPWQVGASGNVIWTGVPLRKVVDALGGVADDANYITGTGGEELPEGVDPLDLMVERSVPLDVLDTVILAWELNGNPISLAHGGPLRMIVPGYTGVNNVKYVKRVAFTEEQSPALIQQTRYRLQPVGEEGGPEHDSVWEMPVKSFVTQPLEEVTTGQAVISGVAFGGTRPVERVEVSVDGGESWEEAELVGPDLGRYAWRTFVLVKDLEAGEHRIVSRAIDSEGNEQPREVEPNDAGYNHNGWYAHGVDITAA